MGGEIMIKVNFKKLKKEYRKNLKILSTTEKLLDKMQKRGICAEIGVFKGENAKRIIKITKPEKLYLIDVYWKEYGKYYPDWGEYTDFGKLKTTHAYKQAKDNVKIAYKKKKVFFNIGDSIKILKKFPDNYFDWVYLDSSHVYKDTVTELSILIKKVRNDGVIAGHDYCQRYSGVIKAVNEFCIKYNYELIFLTKEEYSSWAIKKVRSN